MTIRQRIRLSVWLQQFWQQQSNPFPEVSYQWEVLKSRWQAVWTALHRCHLASTHRLHLSLPMLRYDLISALSNLSAQIAVLRSSHEVVEQESLTSRHWYEEVMQLEDEFIRVSFDAKEEKLRVETPVITLGDVCLGAFAIDLVKDGGELTINRFRVVALAPEPASTDPEVTHPHVKDGELCAGDGKVPIRTALESGRVADVFLLILSTLQNYNSRSAYVKLEQWNGISCSSCARTSSRDDTYECHRCQDSLCDQCYSSCTSCSEMLCPGCAQGCASCKADCCESCLESSEVSGLLLCRDCRTTCTHCDKVLSIREADEADLCQACAEREDAETDDSMPDSHELDANPSKEVLSP